MAQNTVFFHVISNDSIICVSEPLVTIKQVINGNKVTLRKQANRTFGLLCIVDPVTGLTTDPRSLGLEEGQPMPGFHFSSSPVLEQNGENKGKPTGMFWVTATALPEPKAKPLTAKQKAAAAKLAAEQSADADDAGAETTE